MVLLVSPCAAMLGIREPADKPNARMRFILGRTIFNRAMAQPLNLFDVAYNLLHFLIHTKVN